MSAGWEISQFMCERIVLTVGKVYFEIGFGFEFQLHPASHRIKTMNARARESDEPGNQDALADPAAQASHGASAVELAGQTEKLSQRNSYIGQPGPAIYVSAEAPVLASIVATNSNAQVLSKGSPHIFDVRCVCRLPRSLSRRWETVILLRNIAGKRIQNAGLEQQS